jgi:hypothetical protein
MLFTILSGVFSATLYLDGYATEDAYRRFALLVFPEMQQREYAKVPASVTLKTDLLFIGIGKVMGDVQNFNGKILRLGGEASYYNRTTGYYLGPVKTADPHQMQFFYAQLAAAVAGLPRLLAARRKTNATQFLVYRSSHCVQYREAAFHRICTQMEPTPCHASKCIGDYHHAVAARTPRRWAHNSREGPYRFEIAMDNTKMDGYVSEKILNAFLAGAIPIYYGTTDVFKLFHREAFIYYDVTDPQTALDRILYLETNRTAYAEVLAKPILADGALERYFSLSGSGTLKRAIRKMVLNCV